MSTLTIAFPDVTQPAGLVRRAGTGRRKPTGRTSVPGVAPRSRPDRAVPAPSLGSSGRRPAAQACTAEPLPTSWRLTDRGIAAVLAAGLLIMLTALVVVGLTALRVTGSDYGAQGQTQVIAP